MKTEFLSPDAVPSSAVTSGTCGDNLTWTLDDNGTLIISGTGVMPNYTISTGAPWHSSCSDIKTVVINDGVTSIGNFAFFLCYGLTSVTIPDSVTSIGQDAFFYCGGLTSVTIPDSVTSIGCHAFSNNGYIAKQEDDVYYIGKHLICASPIISGKCTIKEGCLTIADSAFAHCDSLTSVTIPDSVTSIGQDAFNYCKSLTSVTIGNSVTTIGNNAFLGCKSLTSVTIPDSVTSIGQDAFNYCKSLTSITIPDSVNSIGDCAFSNCDSLTKVDISDIEAWCKISFAYYGSNPLCYAKNLYLNGALVTNLTIPDSVTYVGDYAFVCCDSLTSVTIPDSVTTIGNSAFSSCRSLTSVTIPDSVTNIGDRAFCDCDSLTDIYYTGSEEDWHEISVHSGISDLTNATIHYN